MRFALLFCLPLAALSACSKPAPLKIHTAAGLEDVSRDRIEMVELRLTPRHDTDDPAFHRIYKGDSVSGILKTLNFEESSDKGLSMTCPTTGKVILSIRSETKGQPSVQKNYDILCNTMIKDQDFPVYTTARVPLVYANFK